MFQSHLQELRPLTTAHLAQTMALLALTNAELRQQIESEIAANPALEIKDERRCPTCKRLMPEQGPCPICSQVSTAGQDEPVVFISPRDDFYTNSYEPGDSDKQTAIEENYSASTEELPAFVYHQAVSEIEEDEQQILIYMLASLDEDGLLTIEPEEIASYFHIPLEKVERIRRVVQHVEPLGVGSLSAQEALTVQLEILSEGFTVPEFAHAIITDGIDLLSRRLYGDLAKKLGVTQAEVEDAVRFISENLYPFPARSHWGDQRQPAASGTSVYHQPDIIINHVNEDPSKPLSVEIIMPLNGTLRVNPLFKQAVKEADEDMKSEWKNDLERAALFVKCIQQRNHTMKRLMQRIVSLQNEFIIHGEKFLAPITRVQISKELGVHESTISRAVSNKSVQLPNRKIIPMAAFFDRSLQTRTVLKEIISKEKKPLSDAELVKLLSRQGYDVARRTVAKYRSMEGILPAHLRKPVTVSRSIQ